MKLCNVKKLFSANETPRLRCALFLLIAAPLGHTEDVLTLPPPPEVIRGGHVDFLAGTPDDEKDNTVSVFYATKRLPAEDGTWYRKKFDDILRVGSAQLQIGRDGLPWSVLHIEATKASEPRMAFDITLTGVSESAELAPDASLDTLSKGMRAYIDQIDAAMAKAGTDHVTIIAHGAFNSFYYAMAEAAQYRFYTGKRAVVIAYSWPAVENDLAYGRNVKNAEASEAALNRLIKILAKFSKAERINLLGYSVGGRLIGGAMAALADEYAAGKGLDKAHEELRLGHLYLTSSDQPLEQFRNYVPSFAKMFDLITVTASYHDPILGRAELTGGGDRLGRPPKPTDKKHGPTAAEKQAILAAVQSNRLHLLNLETTDIPGYEFVHGAWYLNPWVSSDVIVSMNLKLHPSERGLVATGDDYKWPVWFFPPEYVNTLQEALEKHSQKATPSN